MGNSFIDTIVPLVRKYPSKIFNSVTIAQACLESSYGQSDLARGGRNLFGIKASAPWTGPAFNKNSLEERDGKEGYENSDFRLYETFEESIADHATFFESTPKRIELYAKVLNAKTPEEQANALTGVYATSSKYGTSLIRLINEHNLKQYDEEEGGDTVANIAYPKIINETLMNVGPMGTILGVIVHNDYGSALGTPEWYVNWLRTRDKALGIAHYYIDKNTIARVVDTNNIAYHAGNWGANTGGYIGYEVCGSRWDNGLSTPEFLLNEDMTLRQVAEDMLYYELPVNRSTVRLHQEFSSTSCPHRSWDLHGESVNAVKDYFIDKIKYYQSLGKTVREMIDAENGGATQAPEIQSGWVKYDNGWGYRHSDGEWHKDDWLELDGKWYYFDAEGWAYQERWLEYKGQWYYFNDDCSMRMGWVQYKDKWYHLSRVDGHMESREFVRGQDDRLYYLKSDGSMLEATDIKVSEDGSLVEVSTGKLIGAL